MKIFRPGNIYPNLQIGKRHFAAWTIFLMAIIKSFLLLTSFLICAGEMKVYHRYYKSFGIRN